MLFEHIISLLAPHACLSCGSEESLLCGDCAKQLPPADERCYRCQRPSVMGMTCNTCKNPYVPLQVRSCTPYKGVAKDILWRLKADRAKAASSCIGLQCARYVTGACLITYIPTAPLRIRQRGYDQARLIARTVAQCTSSRLLPLLARNSDVRQVGATAQERRKQLDGAFRPINASAIQNASIILIDDVITTGSSMHEATKVLYEAGAAEVRGITFAQT